MIVKNEAPVIRRCLESVLPLIDSWVVVDTGSTDGTQDLIRDFFAKTDLDGELFERPWRDFAHNRSEALAFARSYAQYTLIIDADDTLEVPPDFSLPNLTADSYAFDIEDSTIRYRRTQLVRNALPWVYRGVLHEFLSCDQAVTSGHFPVLMRRNHDGARRRDPETYRKDVTVLQKALQAETDPFLVSRYTFYLAQSYRDCQEKSEALRYYIARSKLGFWQEEVFVSLCQAARIMGELGQADDEILAAYSAATAAVPGRVEALHGAARFCRSRSRFEEGYQYAKQGIDIKPSQGGLFVEGWIYEYGLLDEMALCAYYTGRYQESLAACERLLREGKLPQSQRERIEANAKFSRQKLAASAAAAPAEAPQKLKIAVYTIALNEAHHVDRWVSSAKDADYLVVADTGSTDDTVARLRAAGVTVHSIVVAPWRFDDARNANLALVPQDADICISLDMDEFLLPSWRPVIEAAWKPGTTRLWYQFAQGQKTDGTPHNTFRKSKVHARRGYRWHRMIHEDLQRTEPGEIQAGTDMVIIGHLQDTNKDRSQYLPLMERAHQETPLDAQLCFWLGREQVYAGQTQAAIKTLLEYLAIPDWNWHDERAEAMRLLARLEPDKTLHWLRRAIDEAGHRRELWNDLANHYHSKRDWLNLFWACTNGLENSRLTGSYLDEPDAWGYRLYDFAALACYHMGLGEQAVNHGTKAIELAPADVRLQQNLRHYEAKRAQVREHALQRDIRSQISSDVVLEHIERAVNQTGRVVTLKGSQPAAEEWWVGIVARPGFIHSAALAELAEVVYFGLASMSIKVHKTSDVGQFTNRTIVIGAHLLTAKECDAISSDIIIYNSEHVHSDIFNTGSALHLPHYLSLLRRAVVWDYSFDNAQLLANLLGREVLYVPLGYVPQLTRIPKKDVEDIDVLFYGWLKSRRTVVLDELRRYGLNVLSASGVYGVERDDLISRAKVVMNIHAYLPGAFEVCRIGYLLANGKAVVSELNPGETPAHDLSGSIAEAAYSDLVNTTLALVQDPGRRHELEMEGFQRFARRNESVILRTALYPHIGPFRLRSAMSGDHGAVPVLKTPASERA